ncbi:hypothetical protein NLJ89_g8537 [Agrocybe chaxingu]|uniref:Uncharacterized protein n=1 Tax=Agrocybe chaxingu TaxID=84603 RepID=A0A9W8JXB4_9AGAR|nr:hypothetical protein NLJ89_g8537 [Agrocybe chaxingu]
MRTTTIFPPTISPSSTITTNSTSPFSISAPTLRTTTTSTLPLFVLPPPPPTGPDTSTALPSVAPIPTKWPSIPPGLISPGPPNVARPVPLI